MDLGASINHDPPAVELKMEDQDLSLPLSQDSFQDLWQSVYVTFRY